MAALGDEERVWALLDTSEPDKWVSATLLARRDDSAVELLTDAGERAILPPAQVADCNREEQDNVS